MEFYEKRPVFQAVQFDGTTASVEQMGECGNIFDYIIESSTLGVAVTLNIGEASTDTRRKITLQRREWLVRGPDGHLSTMNDSQIRERFEKVLSAPVIQGVGARQGLASGAQIAGAMAQYQSNGWQA